MADLTHRYFIINKPYNMVSQFVSPDNIPLLGDMSFDFPENTHAIGRLDKDSEGLLILTTNKKITRLMFSKPHERTYLVMVQNVVSEETLEKLKSGISIQIKKGIPFMAKPKHIELVDDASAIYKHAEDAREKFPHSWLLITLTEGKFRQVRKMVLAARHRCLRLIRISIAGLTLNNMGPGEITELKENDFFRLIHTGFTSTASS